MGRKHSKETKALIGKAQLGRKASEETKKKLRNRVQSAEKRAKLSKIASNRRHSEETKEKLRQLTLGRKRSASTIAKHCGKKHTDETKEKCRKAALARWQDPAFQEKMKLKLAHGQHTKGGFRTDIGLYVRSRWEANFVRLLNFLNIEFEYEPKRFIVKEKGKVIFTYLPDFYLKYIDSYIEIKGFWFPDSRKKFDKFLSIFTDVRVDLLEREDYKKLEKKFAKYIPNWEY